MIPISFLYDNLYWNKKGVFFFWPIIQVVGQLSRDSSSMHEELKLWWHISSLPLSVTASQPTIVQLCFVKIIQPSNEWFASNQKMEHIIKWKKWSFQYFERNIDFVKLHYSSSIKILKTSYIEKVKNFFKREEVKFTCSCNVRKEFLNVTEKYSVIFE